jgi:hypothetical protein
MKEKDDYYYSSLSSSFIQLKTNQMFKSKIKSIFFHWIFLLFILIFLISSVIFFQTKNSSITIKHRLKRQISNRDDQQHYTDMLRRIISHRTSSSVLADCTINMAVDGIYRIPAENSLPRQVIRLIEQSFANEIFVLKRSADKIRKNLNQYAHTLNDYTVEKFRNEFSLDLQILLASQKRIKEIDIRIFSYDNGGSYLIKYSRKDNSVSSIFDYAAITNDIIQQETILQSFTISNVRETLKHDPQRVLNTHGWWVGPVICEKNKNEAYMMAHVVPLING